MEHHNLKLMLYFFIAAQTAQVAWPIEKHWLGNLGNLGSNKEIMPKCFILIIIDSTKSICHITLSQDNKVILNTQLIII